jgi:hypothetical protein
MPQLGFTINVTIAQGQGYRVGQWIYFGGKTMKVMAIYPLADGALITGYAVVLGDT